MKKDLLTILAFFFFQAVFAQDSSTVYDPLKDKDIDAFVEEEAVDACHCIDSVFQSGRLKKEMVEGSSNCISKHSIFMQSAILIKANLLGKTGNVLLVHTEPKDPVYIRFYHLLERKLKDKCRPLSDILAFNDDEKNQNSVSKNKAALNFYEKGNEFMSKEDFASAIPWYEKAIAADSVFAFAWDNLAISYRKTNQLEKAVHAYLASLRLDPKGMTALINIPVVYGLLAKPDEAIAAYNRLFLYYPNDPESYYGVALIYVKYKENWEAALDNMCQAYNLYAAQKSAYRADAEKGIGFIYKKMKDLGKENRFVEILSKYHINSK
jgi:tetratricopeptide (TPR) repeat protein